MLGYHSLDPEAIHLSLLSGERFLQDVSQSLFPSITSTSLPRGFANMAHCLSVSRRLRQSQAICLSRRPSVRAGHRAIVWTVQSIYVIQ